VLSDGFLEVPYCLFLYVVDTNGIQISNNVSLGGLLPDHYGRDRSQRPYMREAVPSWGFLLSDAYLSRRANRPSLTALQVIRRDDETLGFLAADFDLRDLPVTTERYEESGEWRQIKGDPAIRGTVFQQCRVDSLMDQNMDPACAILEELLTERRPYPDNALIPQERIGSILNSMRQLRLADETLYLRSASINIFNGMLSLTFSCDGTHYMSWQEFLDKDVIFWLGSAA